MQTLWPVWTHSEKVRAELLQAMLQRSRRRPRIQKVHVIIQWNQSQTCSQPYSTTSGGTNTTA